MVISSAPTAKAATAFWKMVDILRDIEEEWRTGPERLAQLKALLFAVWDSPR
ncbi:MULTISPECIES: hypothetical protein [Mesorhizobium]|uniref:hypothetical protein n=1 Tax=Mesorhizobium TaxID=68287 RepID=UPI000A5FA02B|nr:MULTISPECIES: hypothetical protein [Mesorhizobium]